MPGIPVPGTSERLVAEKRSAFHPKATISLSLHSLPVNPAHPKTPRGVPPSTQRRRHLEFRLPTGSLPARRPPGRYLAPVPRLLSHPRQKNKWKPRGLAAGPYRAAVSFPWHGPVTQRIVPQPHCPHWEKTTTKGASAPKTSDTAGPSGTGHIPSPSGVRPSNVPIPLPSSPKRH